MVDLKAVEWEIFSVATMAVEKAVWKAAQKDLTAMSWAVWRGTSQVVLLAVWMAFAKVGETVDSMATSLKESMTVRKQVVLMGL